MYFYKRGLTLCILCTKKVCWVIKVSSCHWPVVLSPYIVGFPRKILCVLLIVCLLFNFCPTLLGGRSPLFPSLRWQTRVSFTYWYWLVQWIAYLTRDNRQNKWAFRACHACEASNIRVNVVWIRANSKGYYGLPKILKPSKMVCLEMSWG